MDVPLDVLSIPYTLCHTQGVHGVGYYLDDVQLKTKTIKLKSKPEADIADQTDTQWQQKVDSNISHGTGSTTVVPCTGDDMTCYFHVM